MEHAERRPGFLALLLRESAGIALGQLHTYE
jgi:hypothetical protein